MASKDYSFFEPSANSIEWQEMKMYASQTYQPAGAPIPEPPSGVKVVMLGLTKCIAAMRNQLEGTDQHWQTDHHLRNMEALVDQLKYVKAG